MSASSTDTTDGEAGRITLRELDGATLVIGKSSEDTREVSLGSDE